MRKLQNLHAILPRLATGPHLHHPGANRAQAPRTSRIHNPRSPQILWLIGKMPTKAMSIASRIYSHALTTSDEDFDDALFLMWFGGQILAQVQVSSTHVSGYRVETLFQADILPYFFLLTSSVTSTIAFVNVGAWMAAARASMERASFRRLALRRTYP